MTNEPLEMDVTLWWLKVDGLDGIRWVSMGGVRKDKRNSLVSVDSNVP